MAVPEDKWEEAVAELCSYPHVEEAGILSTCNRMEIYVVALSWHRGVREVEEWMSKYSGIPLEELREHLFLLRDQDATSHLLKVSGGLESVVMGEGQILAQVKNVFALGENVDGFGRHLSGLFKAAITAGKRVRSETSIASGAVSVSSAAAENATVSRGKSGAKAASSLLCVDMRNMKAEDELKRIFGGKVISAVEAEEVGRLGGRTAAFRAKLQRRCTFSAYRDQWSTYRSGGLYMVTSGVVDAESGMSDFSFAWKDDYAQANFDFEIAVGSHDPNRLFSLLNHYPWHLETLLRISELYHYSGQAQESSEILERCLYACERAWHPNFTAAASSGLAHLDASQPENKPMFEALFRHVIALTRRGCHKTALECAKLCLGLDHTDPKGMLHMISYFALRSGEEEWLLRFVEDFGHKRWVGGKWELHGSLLNFPDFAYSKAMALYTIADDIKFADAELLKAMLTYPYALTATLMRLEAAVSSDKDWKEILAHEHFDFSNCALDSRSLEHVSDIFATRHHLLWRPDPILHWAKRVARSAIQLVDSMKPSDMIDGLTAAEFVTISLQNWPASEENDFTHLVDDDFTDVVKRALPEDDPLAARGPNDPDHFSDDDDGDEF